MNSSNLKIESLSYQMMNIVSAAALHLHAQASSYLSTFQAHNSLLLPPPPATVLDPLDRRISDKVKTLGDRNYQLCKYLQAR